MITNHEHQHTQETFEQQQSKQKEPNILMEQFSTFYIFAKSLALLLGQQSIQN